MLINVTFLPSDRTVLIYDLTGIPLYILTHRKQNHVKYLPHAHSGCTSSRVVQMESSGNISPWASQLGWMASGPREAHSVRGMFGVWSVTPPCRTLSPSFLPIFLLSFLFVFETGSHVAQAGFELLIYWRAPWTFPFSCFHLPSAGIIGLCHQATSMQLWGWKSGLCTHWGSSSVTYASSLNQGGCPFHLLCPRTCRGTCGPNLCQWWEEIMHSK